MSVNHSPKGYVLENRDKAAQAAEAADKNKTDILAEYDKRGGLIRTEKGEVVPAGTFWDFEKGAPRVGGSIKARVAKVVAKVKKAVRRKK